MDAGHLHILLIEDNPTDAKLFREHLAEVGNAFDVTWAGRLVDGLSYLSQARDATSQSADGFAVVVTDLNLPDSTGLDTLRRVVQQAPHLPIVVVSDLNDDNLAAQAVSEGAQDYLVKGHLQGYWLARSLRHAVERRDARESLLLKEAEFRVAQRIQQGLFPDRPPDAPGLDVAGAVYPASEAAGDYFDYIPMVDGYLGVVIGDVSGHGVGPALLMAEIRAYLRALAHTYADVGYMLRLANSFLVSGTEQNHQFISLFFARLDPQSHSFVYCGAGHNGFLLGGGGNTTRLEPTAIPLSVTGTADFPCSAPFDLHSGDTLLLVTDGIWEAKSRGDELFGSDRVLDVVQAAGDQPAREIIGTVYEAVRDFSGHGPPVDDMTIVVVKAI